LESNNIILKTTDIIPLSPKPEEKSIKTEKNIRIEEEIRKNKLKEIAKMKGDLQLKLQGLSENEECLQKGMVVPTNIKKDKEYYMLSKEDRRALKEEFRKKQQETMDIVHKWIGEKKLRKKKKKELAKIEEEKTRKENEQKEQEMKAKLAMAVANRKEEAIKNMEQRKINREEEIKKQQQQSENFQPQKVYLHQKLEDSYNKKVLLPLLEERKQALADKRSGLKQISKDELDVHARKYEEFACAKEEESSK